MEDSTGGIGKSINMGGEVLDSESPSTAFEIEDSQHSRANNLTTVSTTFFVQDEVLHQLRSCGFDARPDCC